MLHQLCVCLIAVHLNTRICDSHESDRFSQVRRLSGIAYSDGHNLQHLGNHTFSLYDSTRRPPPFRWDVNEILNNKTTSRPPTENKLGKKKKKKGLKKKRKEKTNVWWPWANYEEWLANHKQDQVTKKPDTLELNKEKKKHNKKRGDKKRKKKQNKNKKNRKVKGSVREKSSNGTVHSKNGTQDSMNKSFTLAPEFNSKHIKPYKINNNDKQKDSSVKDHIVEKHTLHTKPATDHLSVGNLKLKELLNPGQKDGVIKIDKEIDMVQNMAPVPPTSNVEYMTRAKDKSLSLSKMLEFTKANRSRISARDDDNEIRHFYNWMPSWKVTQRNFTSDRNECLYNNGGCEGLCINTRGSYYCHCPSGFRLDSSRKNCIDVNECLLRNGHGPCQGECYNRWGSYKCGCATVAGTELAADGHSCRVVDSCATANCTHMCISTRSGAFCTCPQGYVLAQDWKTCQDVDECLQPELQDARCENGCSNSIGSYTCL